MNTIRLTFLPACAILPGMLIAFESSPGHSTTGEVTNVTVNGPMASNTTEYKIEVADGKGILEASARTPVMLLRPFEVGIIHNDPNRSPLVIRSLQFLETINAAGGIVRTNSGNVNTTDDWDKHDWPDLASAAEDTYNTLVEMGCAYACLVVKNVTEDAV